MADQAAYNYLDRVGYDRYDKDIGFAPFGSSSGYEHDGRLTNWDKANISAQDRDLLSNVHDQRYRDLEAALRAQFEASNQLSQDNVARLQQDYARQMVRNRQGAQRSLNTEAMRGGMNPASMLSASHAGGQNAGVGHAQRAAFDAAAHGTLAQSRYQNMNALNQGLDQANVAWEKVDRARMQAAMRARQALEEKDQEASRRAGKVFQEGANLFGNFATGGF